MKLINTQYRAKVGTKFSAPAITGVVWEAIKKEIIQIDFKVDLS